LLAVADETAQMMEYSSQLEEKTTELGRTARALREANEKLTDLSVQKDGFLSQISHELRTPMTSIRAFSDILRDSDELSDQDRTKYATIIHDETLRLTRLLDSLLDLSVLESGQVKLNMQDVNLHEIIERSVVTTAEQSELRIKRKVADEKIHLQTDADRLSQVFINLIANAVKYCDADQPQLRIGISRKENEIRIDFIDNGQGIAANNQPLIFEKFSRLGDPRAAGGAGLGLAISQEIMRNLGGSISYLPGQGGAAFRVILPI